MENNFAEQYAKAVEAQREIMDADNINHPAHYTAGGIECIDYLAAKLSADELRGFLRGNVLKYLSRAGKKGGALPDYQKAKWYLDRLIRLEE